MFEKPNTKLAVACDAFATIAFAMLLCSDIRRLRQESLTFTVTMPDGESSDPTEVTGVAGNKDA